MLAANVRDNPMKQITAVVKPDKLDAVARAVEQAGAHGLTATEVRGFGQEYEHMSAVRPADRLELVQPELRIDVLTPDELAGPVTDAIATAVNTGALGDGKIWVCAVDSVLRVRTGERDLDAV
jgi:nitrogen regulatory protein P-II 1